MFINYLSSYMIMTIPRRLHSHLVTACSVLVLSLASPLLANDFVNSGFETGDFTGWTSGNGATVTNTESHSGSFSFSGLSNDFVSQSFTAIDTSSISELSLWGKRSGGLFDSVTLTYSDNTTENVLVNTLGGSNDWTFVNLTNDLDPGKSLTGFLIYGTSPGPAYLDDFTLVTASRVPESSTTIAMLGLAIVSLATLRRRFAP